MRLLHAASLIAALAACATPAPKPDDMSASAHRQEAARERAAARSRLLDRGDGSSLLAVVPDGSGIVSMDEYGPSGAVPGLHHASPVAQAEAHLLHARDHEAAAADLDRFEGDACAGIAPEERGACPWLVGAGAVAEIAGGIEIRFRPGAPVDDIHRRMRCHFAYAQARGFDEAAGCALYCRGIRIERTDERIIRVTADDEATVARLRRAGREQVSSGSGSGPVRQ